MNGELGITVCAACGGSCLRELAGRAALERELHELWEFHLRRVRPDTPLEHWFDRAVFSHDPPVRLVQCAECATVYRDPAESDADVVDRYADERMDTQVLHGLYESHLPFYRIREERLRRLRGAPGKGLELGSYTGAFLRVATHAGWQFEGVDVNEVTNRFARQQGATVKTGELTDLPADCWDVIAIWNCFEQLPAWSEVLEAVRRRLTPGGLLAIRVPNGEFYGRYAGDGRAKRYFTRSILALNNLLGFPYRAGLSPSGLLSLLEQHGFVIRAFIGDTLAPTADRWTRRWAVWEERVLRLVLRLVSRGQSSPWFEVYAQA